MKGRTHHIDVRSFLKALEGWHIPGLNFMYADVDGNIGWIAHAQTPVRTAPDGLLPVPADRAAWKGFLPIAEDTGTNSLVAAHPRGLRPSRLVTDLVEFCHREFGSLDAGHRTP